MAKAAAAPAAEETRTTEIATVSMQLPAHMQDDAEYAGAGMSERQQDFLLPFLYVAQSNSPQLKRQQADKYIPGLEPGDIFDTATGRFWKGEEGLLVLPAYFQAAEVEWITRKAGGGYVATHSPDDPIVKSVKPNPQDPRERLLPAGPDGKPHQLVETRYHFVVIVDTLAPAVIGFASTGLQVSRQWMTLMREQKVQVAGRGLVPAATWTRAYRVRTVFRTNDQGDWFQMVVSDAGWTDDSPQHVEARRIAREFYKEAIARGGVVLGRPPEDGAASSDSSTSGSPPVDDSDLPI